MKVTYFKSEVEVDKQGMDKDYYIKLAVKAINEAVKEFFDNFEV